MPYSEWQHTVKYNIQNHPGTGLTCVFNIAWRPGMAGDFRCVRFSDGSGSKLQFWCQGYTTFGTATFRVQLKSSANVYLHYGNGTAVSESNSAGMFSFFDAFDGSVIDSSKWTITGSPSVSSGILTCGASQFITGKSSYGGNYVLECRSKFNSTSAVGSIRLDNGSGTMSTIDNNDYYASNLGTRTIISYGANTTNSLGSTYTTDWHNYKIARVSTTSVKFYVDDILKFTHTTNVPTANQAARLVLNSGGYLYVDWVLIRPYLATEPTAVVVETIHNVPWIVQYTGLLPRYLTAEASMSVPTVNMRAHQGSEFYATALCDVHVPELTVSQVHHAARASSHDVHRSWLDISRSGHYPRSALHSTNVYLTESWVLHSERESAHSAAVWLLGAPQWALGRSAMMSIPAPGQDCSRTVAQPRVSDFEVPVVESLDERALVTIRESGHDMQKTYLGGEWVLASQRESGHSVPLPELGTETLSVLFRPADMSIPAPSTLNDPIRAMVRPVMCKIPLVELMGMAVYGQVREASCFVAIAETLASRVYGQSVSAGMSIPAPMSTTEYTLGSNREAAVEIPAGQVLVTTRGEHFAFAYLSVSPVSLGDTRSIASVRETAVQTEVEIEAGVYNDPTGPYLVILSKNLYTLATSKLDYTVVVRDGDYMYEITQYDTDEIYATLYDTDPATGLRRVMPLTGRTVSAVLKGGVPTTTVTRPCTKEDDGRVKFTLGSTDDAVPGLYRLRYLVVGTGFRKEIPEKRSDAQEILVNDALYPE